MHTLIVKKRGIPYIINVSEETYKKYTKTCFVCQKVFSKPYDKKRKACSDKCAKELTKRFHHLRKGKSNIETYGKEKAIVMSTKLSASLKGKLSGIKNPMYGKSPWTSGLTKNTSTKLAMTATKHSMIKRKLFAEGKIIHSQLGKPVPSDVREKIRTTVLSKIHLCIGNPQKSPNKLERKLEGLLNSNFPNEFKFVGNGDVIIGNKIPDFINVNGKKMIIELFGEYWHDSPEEEERQHLFSQYGFKTLIIWGKEMNIPEIVILKIRRFMDENEAKNLAISKHAIGIVPAGSPGDGPKSAS